MENYYSYAWRGKGRECYSAHRGAAEKVPSARRGDLQWRWIASPWHLCRKRIRWLIPLSCPLPFSLLLGFSLVKTNTSWKAREPSQASFQGWEDGDKCGVEPRAKQKTQHSKFSRKNSWAPWYRSENSFFDLSGVIIIFPKGPLIISDHKVQPQLMDNFLSQYVRQKLVWPDFYYKQHLEGGFLLQSPLRSGSF